MVRSRSVARMISVSEVSTEVAPSLASSVARVEPTSDSRASSASICAIFSTCARAMALTPYSPPISSWFARSMSSRSTSSTSRVCNSSSRTAERASSVSAVSAM
jgi:hypothetical protein